MFTTDTIREALGTVLDPELRIDVISLGLVYEVRIDNDKDIYVKLTLTTPGCPLIDFFLLDINKKLKSLEGVGEVKVDLTFDPPWTPDKMSAEAKAALGIE